MREFISREAMIAAAEMEVREEARRHPDDPWTPDRDKRWAARHGGHADVASPEYTAEIKAARKRLRNELLLSRFEQVEKAVNVRDRYLAEGTTVPSWALNVCAWAAEPEKISALYGLEDDETENLEDVARYIRSKLN
jgi:hypothetical protein